jgi:hypothetical protein
MYIIELFDFSFATGPERYNLRTYILGEIIRLGIC